MNEKTLRSGWSDELRRAGERVRKAWEEYFARGSRQSGESRPSEFGSEISTRIARVRATHEAELLRYPNVVGLAEGVRVKAGKPTGEPCLVVYVQKKIPERELDEAEILPKAIDGIPIDVVEVGEVGFL